MPLANIIQANARVVNINHLDFHAKLDFLPEGKMFVWSVCFTEMYKQCLGIKGRIINEFCTLNNPVP